MENLETQTDNPNSPVGARTIKGVSTPRTKELFAAIDRLIAKSGARATVSREEVQTAETLAGIVLEALPENRDERITVVQLSKKTGVPRPRLMEALNLLLKARLIGATRSRGRGGPFGYYKH